MTIATHDLILQFSMGMTNDCREKGRITQFNGHTVAWIYQAKKYFDMHKTPHNSVAKCLTSKPILPKLP